MVTTRKDYRLGPLTITTYPSDEPPIESSMKARAASLSRRGHVVVLVAYAYMTVLTLLWLLYVLVPYYLSGFHRLSTEHIELVNLWLWDFEDYPLFALAGAEASHTTSLIVGGLKVCIGTPLLVILAIELIFNWSRSSRRTWALKGAVLLFVVSAATLGWLSSDNLFALLTD